MTDDRAFLASLAVSTAVASLIVVAAQTPAVEPTGVPDRLLAGLVRLDDPMQSSKLPPTTLLTRGIGPEGCRATPRIRSLELEDLIHSLHPQRVRRLEHEVRTRRCARHRPERLRGRLDRDGHLQPDGEATNCLKEAIEAAAIPPGTQIHIEARWALRTRSRAGTRPPTKSRTATRTETVLAKSMRKTSSSAIEGRSTEALRTSNPPD